LFFVSIGLSAHQLRDNLFIDCHTNCHLVGVDSVPDNW
jgi:hypothetical protein